MGLTIYYSGKLRDPKLIDSFVKETADACICVGWRFEYLKRSNIMPMKGIMITPEGCETIMLTITELNRYLKEQASQDIRRKLTLCFVTSDSDHRVTGYYTLSNASIPRDQLPPAIARKLGYKDVPVTLLGRLARDTTMKGSGHGEDLLMDALFRSYFAAKESSGSVAVITDPIDKDAMKFYSRYGFLRLEGSGRMFIMMATIGELFEVA